MDLRFQQRFDNSYSRLHQAFYTRIAPTPISQPHLVSVNPDAAALIGLDRAALGSNEFLACFSGAQPAAGMEPIAQVYSGHQFGVYVPQLGDGRGILIGENQGWDIHLKGAGRTPYSRDGDGRAVLRSSIREYLGSEALHGLGIPTTRALCLIGSPDTVYRETAETAAILTRLSPSHVRFGSFEYFHYTQQPERVRELADYVIAKHFPALVDTAQPYASFFLQVVERTARTIALWQVYGFAHGVMNTDNMSILGLTFDYGPFGFLDEYQAGFISNHSDYQGRYAFDQQASIGLWNLNALAHALSILIDRDALRTALQRYEPVLLEEYYGRMLARLGFAEEHEGDRELLTGLLGILARNSADYTLSLRALCRQDEDEETFYRFAGRGQECIDWIDRYRRRLQNDDTPAESRRRNMLATNPKFILRNYLAQQAIDQARKGDFARIDALLEVLRNPFAEGEPGQQIFAEPVPDWGKHLEISCSS